MLHSMILYARRFTSFFGGVDFLSWVFLTFNLFSCWAGRADLELLVVGGAFVEAPLSM